MPITVNGTRVTKLIVNGAEKKCVKVGGTCVYLKSTGCNVWLTYTVETSDHYYTSCGDENHDYSYKLSDVGVMVQIGDTDVVNSVNVTLGFSITLADGSVIYKASSQTLAFTSSGTKYLSGTNSGSMADKDGSAGLYFTGWSCSARASCAGSLSWSASPSSPPANTDVPGNTSDGSTVKKTATKQHMLWSMTASR